MYFIRFLLIAILVLYIIRNLVRILLPMLFQSLVNKAQQQGQQQQQYRNPKQPDGKVKVDYIPNNKSQVPDSEGDFVDYEEIK
ncbi:DUF4834 family protein [Mucilaginibacter sp. McL0603]|uniref:DUF4834 family protein n=1 Tax=Mucilaginibacter sp. McL0603 TaxID=3415670 RepID=UPI003CE9763D